MARILDYTVQPDDDANYDQRNREMPRRRAAFMRSQRAAAIVRAHLVAEYQMCFVAAHADASRDHRWHDP
jgi:hypothetical protein